MKVFINMSIKYIKILLPASAALLANSMFAAGSKTATVTEYVGNGEYSGTNYITTLDSEYYDFYGVGTNYDGGNIILNIKDGAVIGHNIAGGSHWWPTTSGDSLPIVPDGTNITVNFSGGTLTPSDGLVLGTYLNVGESSDAKLGDIVLNMSGGTVNMIRGGNNINSASSISDISSSVNSVKINISGGTITGKGSDAIRGGGGSYSNVEGIVDIVVSNTADITGNIYAGARNNGAYVGASSISIRGGTIKGDIFSGGSEGDTSVKGDANIYFSNGTLTGDIHGGGNGGTIEGKSNVYLDAGVIDGNVYGSGINDKVVGVSSVSLRGATLNGNLYGVGDGSTVGGARISMNSGILNGDIYAAGNNGTVLGDVSVIFGDNSENATVSGVIHGGKEAGSKAAVSGTSSIQFYKDISGLKVDGFNSFSGVGDAVINNLYVDMLQGSSIQGNITFIAKMNNIKAENATSYIWGGNVVFKDSEFIGNVYNNGTGFGGIFTDYANDPASTFVTFNNTVVKDNVIENNYAQGGFFYGLSSDFKFEDSTFENNTVRATGDKVRGTVAYANNHSLTIEGSEFKGNVGYANESLAGGTVYIESKSADNVALNVSNSSFVGNKIVSEKSGATTMGGAIMAYNRGKDVSLSITDTVFASNSADTKGGAIYLGGATMTLNATKDMQYAGNSAEEGGFLFLDYDESGSTASSATFNVSGGANLVIGVANAATDSIEGVDKSAISKSGTGILTVNSSMDKFLGSLNVNEGTLNINNGLGASSITIAQGATLALQVNGNNILSNSALTLSNNGALAISAGAGLSAGEYTVSASGISSYGTTKTYGGNLEGNIFKVGEAKSMSIDVAGESVSVADNGRVELSNGEASIVMSFNSGSATVNAVNTTTQSLQEAIGSEFSAMGAYSFDVTMNAGDTVVLSFLIGDSTLNAADFTIYHRSEGGEWAVADDIDNLMYDGEYLSFIVSHFSEYGYAAIPEPSAYAVMLGVLAVALVAYRRMR